MPIKRIFDTFPLQTYAAQTDKDEAVALEIQRRSYTFTERGGGSSELTVEGTYKLGVYNVFGGKYRGGIGHRSMVSVCSACAVSKEWSSLTHALAGTNPIAYL